MSRHEGGGHVSVAAETYKRIAEIARENDVSMSSVLEALLLDDELRTCRLPAPMTMAAKRMAWRATRGRHGGERWADEEAERSGV